MSEYPKLHFVVASPANNSSMRAAPWLRSTLAVGVILLSGCAALALPPDCIYPSSYFLSKSVSLSNVRPDYHLVHAQWSNVSFSESTTLFVNDTAGQRLFYAAHPWETTWGDHCNFYLIAETKSPNPKFIQCYWGPDGMEKLEGQIENIFTPWTEYTQNYDYHVQGFNLVCGAGALTRIDSAFIYDRKLPTPEYRWLHATSTVKRQFDWQAIVPEGDTLILHWGTDFIQGYQSYEPTLFDTVIGTGGAQRNKSWAGWKEYFQDALGASQGAWATSQELYFHYPQPPNAAEVKFVKRWKKDSLGVNFDGENWIPDPRKDSLIGLEFSFTNAQGAASQAVYEVFDVSTWQGDNMNSPHPSDVPHAVGDSTFFDFDVVNPIGQFGPKYTIQTTDRDYVITGGNGWGNGAPSGDAVVSERRYTVVRNALVTSDILWLEARDYAAHAIVLPHTGCPNLRLRDQHWRYDTTVPMWSVSAPRDDDGYYTYGVNWGDHMGDAWEETVLGKPQYDPAILSFYPFYKQNAQKKFDSLLTADDDSKPTGRGINGDRLVNWEEYRGFTCLGTPDTGFYMNPMAPKAIRLDPTTKDIFLGWQIAMGEPFDTNMVDTAVVTKIPAYITSLDAANFHPRLHFAKTYLMDNDSTRFRITKSISENRIGSSIPYYSVPTITTNPLGTYIEGIVTWWKENGREPDYNVMDELGETYYFGPRGWTVPSEVVRIVICTHKLDVERSNRYYSANPLLWPTARERYFKDTMTHEFGHSIGMPHINDLHVMQDSSEIEADSTKVNYGELYPNPQYFSTYSGSDRSKFTIRRSR